MPKFTNVIGEVEDTLVSFTLQIEKDVVSLSDDERTERMMDRNPTYSIEVPVTMSVQDILDLAAPKFASVVKDKFVKPAILAGYEIPERLQWDRLESAIGVKTLEHELNQCKNPADEYQVYLKHGFSTERAEKWSGHSPKK